MSSQLKFTFVFVKIGKTTELVGNAERAIGIRHAGWRAAGRPLPIRVTAAAGTLQLNSVLSPVFRPECSIWFTRI